MAKRQTRRKPKPEIPATFVPLFWEKADSRLAIVREIKSRYEELKADTGCDSLQRDILCQRATFMVVYLETVERQAIEEGKFDPGPWTQMVNSLMGLLRTLGLNRAAKQVESLSQYVEGKK